MGQKAGDRLSSSMGGQTRRIFVLHQKQRLAAGMGREVGDLIAFFAALHIHVDMVNSSLVMGFSSFPFLSSFSSSSSMSSLLNYSLLLISRRVSNGAWPCCIRARLLLAGIEGGYGAEKLCL
jgi:hypothetical protein